MELTVKSKRFSVDGMTCVNCQNKIEKKLRNTAGVRSAKVSYRAGTVDITYDTDMISLKHIRAVVEKLGYRVVEGNDLRWSSALRVVVILTIIAALYILLQQFGLLNLLVSSQLADEKMGYGMLFVIGLVTSVHCIAMCGGINLSQCIPRGEVPQENQSKFAAFVPALQYNLGRVLSYTVIGFILGFVGLVLGGTSGAGLPVLAQGILKLIAGVFMVIMGINMLGIFPWLRRLMPRMPKAITRRVNKKKFTSRSPLIVGLLNGFMPCGPLQSMQIVALASGNPLTGAFSMFLFSMGTVPLMLGLGSIVSALGQKFSQKVMGVGAVLVVVLGLAMLSQGGSLSGLLPPHLLMPAILGICAIGIASSLPYKTQNLRMISTIAASVAVVAAIAVWGVGVSNGTFGSVSDADAVLEDGTQVINSTLTSSRYPNITVTAGTPVKWVIDAPQGSINGCNNRINIHEYGITDYAFKTGENVIEFTPTRAGRFQYSCWMGMISGYITVTEADVADTTIPSSITDINEDGTVDTTVSSGFYQLPACCAGH